MSLRLVSLAAVMLLAGAAAAEPRLRARIVVDDGIVTLGDVLADAGEAGDAVLARSPEPGRRMIIGVGHISAVARARGLDWRPLRGLDRIVVRRASRRVARAEIEELITKGLAETAPGGNLRVALANRGLEIHLPTDSPIALEVENLAYDRRNGRFSATIVAARGTPGAWRSEVRGRAYAVVEVPVLRHAVRRGDVIGEGDLDWTELRADRLPASVVTDPGELVGRTPRRVLRPGQPIRAEDVRAPIVVAKGASVIMTYHAPAMVLSAGGRALEDGAMGEMIRVLNTHSNTVVKATVAGGNLVTVAVGSRFAAY